MNVYQKSLSWNGRQAGARAQVLNMPGVVPIHRLIPARTRVLIIALFGCLLIPRGVELQLGTIMIDTSRLILTIFTLIALSQLFSGTIAFRATAADWFIACHILIIAISAIYHKGTEGLEDASAVIIDMGLAYFVARIFITNIWSYRYFVRIALFIAAISAAFACVETITGFSIIRAGWHTFFPGVNLVYLEEQRHGFYRAQAAFREHILFGMYCIFIFALAVLIVPQKLGMTKYSHRFCLMMCLCGTIASMSSAPLLGLGVCMMCLIYARLTRNVKGNWKYLFMAIVIVFIMLNMVSNRGPVKLAIDYLTLDPSTGHFRLEMWESVISIVKSNWLIGWGWGDNWPRPSWYVTSSMDSYYAVWMVRSGIFSVLALLGYIAYSWYKAGAATRWGNPVAREATGWLINTICLFVTILTVHLFSNMVFAVFFALGAGQILITNQIAGPQQETGNTRNTYIGQRRVMQRL